MPADDVAAASALLQVAGVSDAIVGFHAQQAVEKAIKAVLRSRGIDYPFTHDLELLAALADRAGTPLPVDLGDVPRPLSSATVDRSRALGYVALVVAISYGNLVRGVRLQSSGGSEAAGLH